MRNSAGVFLGTQSWSPAKIGGLGFCSGGDIAADGSVMAARTDVGGAYRRESTASAWTQIISTDHMTLPPQPGLTGLGNSTGCYEIAIAPSDAAIWYMGYRGRIMRSTNRGVDWVDDSLNGSTGCYMGANDQANGNVRSIPDKLKVDPSNSAVAYLGTQANGLWRRLSGAWAQIATVPASTLLNAARIIVIAVDPTSSLTGSGATSRRSIVYAASSGNGIYKSTDGGTTFSLLADTSQFSTGTGVSCTTNSTSTVTTASTAGMVFGMAVTGTGIPSGAYVAQVLSTTTFTIAVAGALVNATNSATNTLTFYTAFNTLCMMCDSNGLLWFCVDNGSGTNVWTYNGAWTQNTVLGVGSRGRVWSIAQDPKTAGRYVGMAAANNPFYTTDSGATWKAWSPPQQAAVATDIPIIASVLNSTFAGGKSGFGVRLLPHPTLNRDYIFMGLGVCYFASPWPASTASTLTWVEASAGIEELVANDILITPDGDTICSSQDKALIRLNPDGYPSSSFPAVTLATGFGSDYAIDNHQWIAGMVSWQSAGYQDCISTDGGRSWALMPTQPTTTKQGGYLAVSNAGVVFVCPGGNSHPKYTTDGCVTWAESTFAGFTQPAEGASENGWGWSQAFNTRRHAAVADKDNAGTFYVYNYGATGNVANSRGLWKSTDSGANFALVARTDGGTASIINPLFATFHAQLRMDRGVLYLCGGESGQSYDGDAANITYRSEDGGATWTALGELYEINVLAIGAPGPGSSYHTLYALGWKTISGVPTFGLYRSLNKGAQWTLLQNSSSFDHAYAMAADPRTAKFGRVVVGRTGTGYEESNYSYNLLFKAA
jgi:xyloglucan-specific exo-beta-1,4-glucanase